MFSPECVLPSCFLPLSSHQGDGIFSLSLTSSLSAVVISWSSCSGDLARSGLHLLNMHLGFLNSEAYRKKREKEMCREPHAPPFVISFWDYLPQCCPQVHGWHRAAGWSFLMSIPFDKKDKNSRCAFFIFPPWGCLPASFFVLFFQTQSLPSLRNRCHPFEAVERILLDGSHRCQADKRGTRRLLVQNTCAWARQCFLAGFDWLPATSLFPPRVPFTGCTLLWSCQNLIATPTQQKANLPSIREDH